MKFEVARAEETFRELGDPRLTGADGEARVADFLAGRFESMGYRVERREATGSRFPQRVLPWIGWLVPGALLTANYGLIRRAGVVPAILAGIVAIVGFLWLSLVLGGRIRFGRRRPPLESSPVVIAWPLADAVATAPVRVVFQATLGGPGVSPWNAIAWAQPLYTLLENAIYLFLFVLLAIRIGAYLAPARMSGLSLDAYLVGYVYPGLLAAVWIGIASLLAWEYRQRSEDEPSARIDRRGLAVLLEMARSWPRHGSRPVEPVFVATGDELLDWAASQELVRLLEGEWTGKPTLLIILVAPGAGRRLGICPIDSSPSDFDDLVDEAGRSLWIPVQKEGALASAAIWSHKAYRPAVAIVGSDPRAFFDDSIDLQALNLAAQLATEIALRWAKKSKEAGSPDHLTRSGPW